MESYLGCQPPAVDGQLPACPYKMLGNDWNSASFWLNGILKGTGKGEL